MKSEVVRHSDVSPKGIIVGPYYLDLEDKPPTPEVVEAERRICAWITMGVPAGQADTIPDDGRRYTREDWTTEEFDRAVTTPTDADRLKWYWTTWGNGLPQDLITYTPEEWAEIKCSGRAEALMAIIAAEINRLVSIGELDHSVLGVG